MDCGSCASARSGVRWNTSSSDDDEQEVEGSQSTLDMHYLVGSPSGIEHLVESHRLTLFTLAEYDSAFLASGLTFEFDPVGPAGRGAFIGLVS